MSFSIMAGYKITLRKRIADLVKDKIFYFHQTGSIGCNISEKNGIYTTEDA
jgi:hypothetical protein